MDYGRAAAAAPAAALGWAELPMALAVTGDVSSTFG